MWLGIITVFAAVLGGIVSAHASSAGLTAAVSNLSESTNEIARMAALNNSLQEKLLGQDASISKLAEESFKP
jgi:hypothetical protein